MKTTWLMMRGVLATMWGMGLCQGQSLTVNLANNPIQLEPNLAGQKVVIMGMNGTGGPVEVTGGYLTFQVDGGQDTSSQPSITGLDVVSGTPWEGVSSSVLQQVTATTGQFWSVTYLLMPEEPPTGAVVTIPSGSFRLAEVTFDTTSLSGGSWTFAMTGAGLLVEGDSYLVLADAAQETLVATLGSVTVVPEPMSATAATGLAAGLAGCWLVRRRRRGACATSISDSSGATSGATTACSVPRCWPRCCAGAPRPPTSATMVTCSSSAVRRTIRAPRC